MKRENEIFNSIYSNKTKVLLYLVCVLFTSHPIRSGVFMLCRAILRPHGGILWLWIDNPLTFMVLSTAFVAAIFKTKCIDLLLK